MSKSHIKTLGSSSHTEEVREKDDYYATHPDDVGVFLDKLAKDGEVLSDSIWEPACGQGHISEVLIDRGYNVLSSDLVNRGYGNVGDFLDQNDELWQGDIITNPPFKIAKEFIEKSMSILRDGNKLILLLPLRYLETKIRYALFQELMPKYCYVYSYRIDIGKSGEFHGGNAVAYCWYVWEQGFCGETTVRFIPRPNWECVK
tara:strand:+ start:193 stop:798 length:606 start_codon:yes stop_codon:yes gene_type:complete